MKKTIYIIAMAFTLNCIAQDPNFLEHTIFLSGNPNVNNLFNSVTLQIDLIPGNNEITRPFIIAEGLDTGHIITPDKAYGDTNLITFDRSLTLAGGNLRNQIDPTYTSQSFDLIYINWNNGTGNIKDNSILLENVIDWVNQEKTTTEPIVLLGQSMGGVIGKYTLARMEQEDSNFDPNNPATSPHEVRLFIAHDAPLQGSNTAISTQHFSRHMLNFYIDTPIAYFLGEYAIPATFDIAQLGSSIINLFGANTSVDPFVSPADYLTVQDTPAAVQMNYYWVDALEQATPVFHDSWQTEFEAMGYPQASRNVAISNGNECAVDHGFAPGDVLIEIDDLDNPDFFGDIVHMLGTSVGGDLSGNVGLSLLGTVPGSSKWFYKFDLHATPENGRVYYGRVSYEKKLLWLIETTVQVTQRSIDAPSGILPYDSFSGGYFDVDNVLDDLPQLLPPLIVHHNSFGFIPVVSSLDIQRNNAPKPGYADYLKAYAGGKVPDTNLSSSFDNFIVDYSASQINNEHISFQQRNGDWLSEELNGNNAVSDCSAFCSNVSTTIVGLSSICNLGTYTLNNSNYVPTWSITSGGNLVNMVVNGNSVTIVKSNAQTTGNITLQAFIGSGNECNFQTTAVTKNISLSAIPTISFDNTALRDAIIAGTTLTDESPFVIESGDIININTTTIPDELKWKFTGSQSYNSCLPFPLTVPPNSVNGIVPLISYTFATPDSESTPLGSSTAISIPANSYGYLEVEATASNDCGCHTETNVYISEDTSTPPPPVLPPVDFTASPNPFSSSDFVLNLQVTRTIPEPVNQIQQYNCTFEILNLVTGFSYYNNSFLFNTNQMNLLLVPNAPVGTHVMKLSYSGETVTKLLVVQ